MIAPGLSLSDLIEDFSELPRLITANVKFTGPAAAAALLQRFAVLSPREMLGPALDGIGATDVSGYLVGWWLKQREIEKVLDTSRRDPGQTEWIALASHSIPLSFGASIDFSLQGWLPDPLFSAELEIRLEVTLEAALLEIRGGSTISVRPGRVSGVATVHLQGREEPILSSSPRSVELPGRWELGASGRIGAAESEPPEALPAPSADLPAAAGHRASLAR
jgi:hypothetical protein